MAVACRCVEGDAKHALLVQFELWPQATRRLLALEARQAIVRRRRSQLRWCLDAVHLAVLPTSLLWLPLATLSFLYMVLNGTLSGYVVPPCRMMHSSTAIEQRVAL